MDLDYVNKFIYIQKQPPRGIPRKWCSENMQQIYRRTPMPKCDFNKSCKENTLCFTEYFPVIF